MHDAFSEIDEAYFEWQTTHPAIVGDERALFAPIRHIVFEKLLEVGCGQGANVMHLDAQKKHGVDPSIKRIEFASARQPHAHFACASAEKLPYAKESFDGVLMRDVLHHVSDVERALLEVRRVLRKDGYFYIVEPNRFNPAIFLWAVVMKFDRSILKFSHATLREQLVKAGFRIEREFEFIPLPVSRILFHHQFGIRPTSRLLVRLARAFQSVLGFLIPRSMFTYRGFLVKHV